MLFVILILGVVSTIMLGDEENPFSLVGSLTLCGAMVMSLAGYTYAIGEAVFVVIGIIAAAVFGIALLVDTSALEEEQSPKCLQGDTHHQLERK